MYQPPKNGSDAAVDDYGATVVTGSELAAVLGLSEARFAQLTAFPDLYIRRRKA